MTNVIVKSKVKHALICHIYIVKSFGGKKAWRKLTIEKLSKKLYIAALKCTSCKYKCCLLVFVMSKAMFTWFFINSGGMMNLVTIEMGL